MFFCNVTSDNNDNKNHNEKNNKYNIKDIDIHELFFGISDNKNNISRSFIYEDIFKLHDNNEEGMLKLILMFDSIHFYNNIFSDISSFLYLLYVKNNKIPINKENVLLIPNKRLENFDEFYNGYVEFCKKYNTINYQIIVTNDETSYNELLRTIRGIIIGGSKRYEKKKLKSALHKMVGEFCIFHSVKSNLSNRPKSVSPFNKFKTEIYNAMENKMEEYYVPITLYGRKCILIPIDKIPFKVLSKKDMNFICRICGLFGASNKYSAEEFYTMINTFVEINY